MPRCEFCGEEALQAKSRARSVPFEGTDLTVEVEYSICEACGEAQITSEQAKRNRRAVNEAKRALLGIPSTVTLRKMRARWKMTQSVAGKLLGVGPTAFSKYENGEVLPAAPTARLLYLICQSDEAMGILVEKFGHSLGIQWPHTPIAVSTGVSPQQEQIVFSNLDVVSGEAVQGMQPIYEDITLFGPSNFGGITVNQNVFYFTNTNAKNALST